MSTVIRKIIEIDEERCDGCGNCIPSCAEGALAIIDGKARIVKDMYCDGLGACLGHCPQDALKIIEREAEEFDEEAAMEYVRKIGGVPHAAPQEGGCPSAKVESLAQPMECGCPGSAMQDFAAPQAESPCACMSAGKESAPQASQPSELTHWPVKLRLIPPHAPFLKGADLLIVADCAPVAYAGLHQDFLAGKKALLACPKFEDAPANVAKLADIFSQAKPASVTVLRMEVPCCQGLSVVVDQAKKRSGVDVPVREMVISRQGQAVEGPGAAALLT